MTTRRAAVSGAYFLRYLREAQMKAGRSSFFEDAARSKYEIDVVVDDTLPKGRVIVSLSKQDKILVEEVDKFRTDFVAHFEELKAKESALESKLKLASQLTVLAGVGGLIRSAVKSVFGGNQLERVVGKVLWEMEKDKLGIDALIRDKAKSSRNMAAWMARIIRSH